MAGRAHLALFGIVTAGAIAALSPAPAMAQVQDRILDIYGDDRCPSNNGQEIVVCRKHPEGERFRIPKDLRDSDPAPQALGGGAVSAVNSTGGNAVQVQSCNSVGAGVNAGCFKNEVDAWKARQRAQKKAEENIPLPN